MKFTVWIFDWTFAVAMVIFLKTSNFWQNEKKSLSI